MTAAGKPVLVTGCAGFLGSHLCEALLDAGQSVVGVDCFTGFYPRALKEANLERVRRTPGFRLVEADIATEPLAPVLRDIEVVYHLAAQAGVRDSFGESFDAYLHHNVRGTEQLLEAVADRDLAAFVYASSSSVYGDQDVYPASEDAPLRPVSPYGATKIITEQLAGGFWRSRGVPVVGMRYFTVYGPRQRPDMAFSRFLTRAVGGRPLTVFGDGQQVREFTYVDDVVRSTIAAASHGERGSVYNVGGGQPASVLEVIALLEETLGRPLVVEHTEAGQGDPRRTEADITRAAHDLAYRPSTPLRDGLAAQLECIEATVAATGPGRPRCGQSAARRRSGRMSPAGAGSGPRVLAYSHDGYGLGHLRRNLRIVSGLRRQRPDVHAMVLTGAKSADRLAAACAIECVRLPAVVKVANGRYVGDDPAVSFEEVMRRRSALIADVVRSFQPDLFLVDRYPRGMRDELAGALRTHAALKPGAHAVLGLRDILDSPAAIREEWRATGHSAAILERYARVLCYGDPAVYDPIREYGFPSEIADRIRFTGYLADDVLAPDVHEVRRRYAASSGRLAVCTLGGGKDAAHIAEAFLSAMNQLRTRGWIGVLITGPYMAQHDVDRLRSHPGARYVPLSRMVDDLPSHLAAADAAVCMGGYNTSCEVLALGVPAVVVPRTQPRQEQLMRAERLAARGLVQLLHPNHLSPRVLADRIEDASRLSRSQLAERKGTVAHGGVSTSARYLTALLPVAESVETSHTRRHRGPGQVEVGVENR